MSEKKVKRLSDFVSKNDYVEHLEDEVWDGEVIIDEGFYLEVYINPNGVEEDEDDGSSDGYTFGKYINKEISLDDFLNLELFDEGSLKEGTMTISVIPNEDSEFDEYRKRLCTNLFE